MGNLRSLHLTVILGLLLFCTRTDAAAEQREFDWQAFDAAIKEHVRQEDLFGIQTRVVAYERLMQEKDFLAIAGELNRYNPGELLRDEKLAFYINTYNYLAIKIVIDNWPVESIKDIGSFFSPVWRKTAGYLNNKPITLNTIEHEILRKMGEPRIHFAIVCSSNSCPDLRAGIYTAVDLDNQLDDQVRKFVNNRGKGATILGDELHVSRIFDWFEEDFEEYGGVIQFLSRFGPEYAKHKSFKTLNYDWRLNNTLGQ